MASSSNSDVITMDAPSIRSASTMLKPVELYGDQNEVYFSIKLHHNGKFTLPSEGGYYLNGKTHFVDYLEINNFDEKVLFEIAKPICKSEKLYFYFWHEEEALIYGLSKLSSPNDFEYMKKWIRQENFNIVPKIFVDHDKQTLWNFYPQTLKKAPTKRKAELLYDLESKTFTWRKV